MFTTAKMETYGFKVHLKLMLVLSNYYFLIQELCLFVYRPVKTFNDRIFIHNQYFADFMQPMCN